MTTPSRIGGTGDSTVDGGELGDGEAADTSKGRVPAERGTVQPYQDVMGAYAESYFSSTDRLGLPADLQKIVESYFSSIESD